jgi:[acyl-carrier-protein] S-malonyltransferase
MGKEIYETYETAREFFHRACELLDFDMKQLCFDGPLEQLSQTEYTQACLVACEVMILKVLKEHGIVPDICAGLSLGEYSALVAANALDAYDAVKLVRTRGQIMSEALPVGISSMAAILGMNAVDLEVICQELTDIGIVEIANYNCPGQLVIGGEIEAVKKASELAIERGARKVIPLKVSGAFHTLLLKDAGAKLREELNLINFGELEIPVVFNKTACYQDAPLVDLLEAQVYSPVRFEDSIRLMMKDGVDTFIEVGPGKTLSGFLKKIDRKVQILNVENVEDLNRVIEQIGGHQE